MTDRPRTQVAPGRLALEIGYADPERKLVRRDGEDVPLTTREAGILAYLAAARPRPVTVGELLEEVCGLRADTATHTVQTTIYTLRRKIERIPRHPRHLLRAEMQAYTFVEAEPEGLEAVFATVGLLESIDGRGAASIIETLLASGTPVSRPDRVRLRVALGSIAQRQGDLGKATKAVADLRGATEGVRGRGHLVRALIAFRRRQPTLVDSEIAEAKPLLRDGGRVEALWRFHSTLHHWSDVRVLSMWASLVPQLDARGAAIVRASLAASWLARGELERAIVATAHPPGPHPYEARVLLEARAVALARLERTEEAHATWREASLSDPLGARLEEPYGWGIRAAYEVACQRDPGPWRARVADCPFSAEVGERLLANR